jgi:RNA polymerase sigma-70 factor, ECF subfamily
LGEPAEKPEAITDSQLLQRHLAGDSQAFGAIVSRYEKELFGFLARLTGDVALAEDVFQDTFLQLHLSARTFDFQRRLRPWLFTIAANKARDAMRSRRRRPAASLDAPVGQEGQSRAVYADLLEGKIPPPDEAAENLETRRLVEDMVRQMPENLQIVLLLNYFHGFAYKQIAEILEIPLGTVKSRLHAAVAQFAQMWKAHAEGGRDDDTTNG